MQNTKTVHQLRKEGYKVKIRHSRFEATADHKTPWGAPIPIQDLRNSNMPIFNKGGLTEVSLTTPEGKTYYSEAQCSLHDNFNYRLGVTIALNRIFSQIEEEKNPSFLKPEEALNKILAKKGKFFTVTFVKRTDGERRVLNGRLNVKKISKGGVLNFDPTQKKLLQVYDVKKAGHRFVPLDSVISVK